MQIDMKGKKISPWCVIKKKPFEETQIQKENFPFLFN
jgi:hypothetical protein